MNELIALGTVTIIVLLTLLPRTKTVIKSYSLLLKGLCIGLCVVLFFLSEHKDKPYLYLTLISVVGYLIYDIYKIKFKSTKS